MENKIRELREERGLLQVDLAKKLGITQAALSYLETGKHNLTQKRLHSIAKALNVQPWEILNVWTPTKPKGGIMKKLFSFIFAPFMWVALGIRGGLAFILRSCFGCMVVYPKTKGKKNGK